MGIYIKGLKAPESCSKCRLSGWSNYYQLYKCDVCDQAVAKYASEYQMAKPEWCPIVEILEPHGRLIDGDALQCKVDDIGLGYYEVLGVTEDTIDSAPTIIEAEGSEDA